MEKILGIDLGTNSIGAILRDASLEGNQFVEKIVLTFDKGVGEVKGIEIPLVKARTEARGKRRNYQAEKYRKWELLKFLIEKNMCPLSEDELNEWKHYKKGGGRKYPQSKKFIQWLRFDFNGDGKPDFELFGFNKHESYYIFRVLVVNEDEQHKKIFENNPNILGRILYQLVQRRGYRGRDDEDEEAKTIRKGSEKNGTPGTEIIAPYIQKHKTLGAGLYHLQKEKNARIRKRYNLRTDYEQELKEICHVQNLDETTYKKLWKAIIWQRPLRSQKGLVGVCTFEKNKARCPISHPLYEEFRTWIFINNLKISLPPDIDKASYLQKSIYPLFYNASRDFKLTTIEKRLRKDEGIIKAKFPADTKVVSCMLLNNLESLLGKDWKENYGWEEALQNQPKKCAYSFEDIWHVLFSFDSKEKLKEFAEKKLLLNEEGAEKFTKIRLQQGYATLSLSAIKKILPYLYQGFIYSEAVYLANIHKLLGDKAITLETIKMFSSIIKDVIKEHNGEKQINNVVNGLISDQLNSEQRFGMDANYKLDDDDRKDIQLKLLNTFGAKTWEETLTEDERKDKYNFAEQHYLAFLQKPITAKKENLFIKSGRLHDKIFDYLKDTYDILDDKKHKALLWHPSEQETYPDAKEKNGIKILGDPRPISNGFKNPMALRTLHELKKLINYLLETGKIDDDTRIVIEIARELNDSNMRKAIEKFQRDREKENDEFKKKIDEINKECNTSYNREDKNLIDKIRLWNEQYFQCIYTGKIINSCDLLDGSKYNYEHSVPATLSFDNELKNLTIADIDYNMNIKGNKIPFDCPNYDKDVIINGIEYTAIQPRLKFIEEKVEHLESLLDEWINKTKFASTKEIKDACIQRRHLIKFDLDYWRKKLKSFIDKEYKAGWKNSQLRDTQIVTKYALPYLKTIFKKVEVQKGTVTAAFREIYKIQPRLEKKQRTKHSHHAIDAAVLTLIPPAATRDKILLRYNEEKDKNSNNTYHETPRNWKNFETHFVLSIEDEVLNNFQAQNRMLNDTKKNVRKRGKQQYLKYKDANNKWHYKFDEQEKRIPLIAKGDTIRGQLHKESFFAAIKLPEVEEKNGKFIPKTDNKGNFIFQTNEKRKDNIFIVKREEDLSSFTKLEDLDIVIDPNLRQYLKIEIQSRINEGKNFAQAMTEPIWAFGKPIDKNGNPIKPIRHIRTKVKGGGGGYVTNPAIIKPINSFISKQEYKRNTYALNGETAVCAFYQGIINDELERIIQPYSILEIAQLKNGNNYESIVSPHFEKTIKKAQHLIPLYAILKTSQRVLFFEEDIDELKKLSIKELGERLYMIVKFEDGRISFKHHLNSMSEEDLKKEMKKHGLADVGASAFNFKTSIPKLRLSKSSFNFAIEGKHFEIKPDGKIFFKF
jgi:CRISPR-associated endonuclease Csn1